MFAVYIPLALMFVWVFARWVRLSLDATNGSASESNEEIKRLFVILWAAFNVATAVGGVIGLRAAWLHLPQPVPPLLTMFTAALWFGLFFVSSAMLVKALIRRGAFGDPECRLSQPSSPSSDV
jgi:hypothetical protein